MRSGSSRDGKTTCGGPAERSAGGLGTIGELLAARGAAVTREAPTPVERPLSPAQPRDAGAPDLGRCGKIVVRRERKGHAGKTTTVVDGLGLASRDLERLARVLRRALGCGASVDGERVVVQGDHSARLPGWLSAHGARRVVAGN